jgi:GNAT superfamily N-acetyltransferase
MDHQIEIKEVKNETDFLVAKELILEYVKWLGIDLSFQNFDKEIDTLQVTYGEPDGGLCLALRDNKAVGVAGIKRFDDRECELKRMFVQPGSRGFGIGKLILTRCIEIAKKLNYDTIKLDTADFMKSAVKLYIDNGFVEIPAYRYNPYDEARYFELNLKANFKK